MKIKKSLLLEFDSSTILNIKSQMIKDGFWNEIRQTLCYHPYYFSSNKLIGHQFFISVGDKIFVQIDYKTESYSVFLKDDLIQGETFYYET